ncbi:DUF4893 domain-containing protein [Phyllobacterium sp. 0TCS1.6C]|uniref:DUF4893 domain-containing protein n=1 Tax=unclassified Phyllobacterium TaxID=2638441 RepID=UPI002264AC1E|nr:MULTISPECIES: DUF4893 domain-containing protein [unclassified Phyllobacterium]MCX8279494.1 DUF4893 domain-containing protein [Phyllobacterium sp. 0TCS1.6C]MCX8292315.1 DUF4893 domain-containing protein [Phyllobacterium sp. 0TCS1.6A]
MLRVTLIVSAMLLAVLPAKADGTILKIITRQDSERLAGYETTRKQALEEARRGSAQDVAILDGIIARPDLPFGSFGMTGDWKCRTLKLGGNLPLVVYGWFKCRVTDDGSGWQLEKLTGSQRTKGRFYTDGDNRLTYLGSGYIAGEATLPYGSGAETDEVGYAYRTSDDAFRIEFPAPAKESRFNILELAR